jgi:hypothetical protein
MWEQRQTMGALGSEKNSFAQGSIRPGDRHSLHGFIWRKY